MKFLSTASVITQAFKNATRVQEILRVFVSHGFAEVIQRMHLSRFLPSRHSAEPRFLERPIQERLRLSFEQLGPTFVKLGQLLASRPDIIPESFVDEFEKLQDRVASVPVKDIRAQIESEFKRPIDAVFDDFEEIPMAAASMAQVHGAKLKTGERVAIKVQRPGIPKIIHNDISIIRGLATLLEHYIPESRMFNPTGVVDEFFRTIAFELDFRVEANNMRRIRKNLETFTKVAIPKVYADLSTERVLVLERFDGIRFSDREALQTQKIKAAEIVDTGCDIFFHMVMHDGLFHGDFHAGNLFILSENRIGLIDFGIVGRLSKGVRDSVITMFVAIMDEDFDSLASEYIDLCQQTGECDIQLLQKDLMDLISPYLGMSLGDVDAGKVLLRSTSVAARHHLRVPRELMLLFKAMVTIEGLGKTLDPHFDLFQTGTRLARSVLSSRYSTEQLRKELIVVGRDVQYLLETTPRVVKRFLRKWSQDNFAVEVKNKETKKLTASIRRFTYFFVLCSLTFAFLAIGITFLVLDKEPRLWDYSFAGLLFFFLALFNLMHAVWSLRIFRK